MHAKPSSIIATSRLGSAPSATQRSSTVHVVEATVAASTWSFRESASAPSRVAKAAAIASWCAWMCSNASARRLGVVITTRYCRALNDDASASD